MRKAILVLAVALALPGYAQEKPPVQQPAAEDVEKRLEAARDRLEEAAREVAELSTQLGGPILDQFVAFGGRRSIIGVQLDPENRAEGARIDEVSPGGPAAEAGLRRGDVIVAVNGKDLKGERGPVRELTRVLRETEPDTRLKLRYLRDGKPREVDVVTRGFLHGHPAVRALPHVPAMPDLPHFAIEPGEHFDFRYGLRGELSGMELATLTPKLGEYFGTGKGVLVLRAPESETFRLQDGDVILSVDGREPRNGSHATRILRSYQPGEKMKLRVMRQKKALELDVTVPEPERRRAARMKEERV